MIRCGSGCPDAPRERKRIQWPCCCWRKWKQPESIAAVQVFATDIDDEALQFARTGIYPESIVADVGTDRLCAGSSSGRTEAIR